MGFFLVLEGKKLHDWSNNLHFITLNRYSFKFFFYREMYNKFHQYCVCIQVYAIAYIYS